MGRNPPPSLTCYLTSICSSRAPCAGTLRTRGAGCLGSQGEIDYSRGVRMMSLAAPRSPTGGQGRPVCPAGQEDPPI